MDLEVFREIFKDKRVHLALAEVLRTTVLSDRSAARCAVSVWPEQREINVGVAFEATGPNAGIFMLPVAGDLVLVAFPEADDDHGLIIKRLTSREDKIPASAIGGDLVLKSLASKKAWLSGLNVNLSQGDTAPTENLVLGQQLKTLLVDILTQLHDLALKVSTHTHVGNIGFPTSAPNEAADFLLILTEFDNLKSSPVQDEAILSDFAFTEKGT